MEHKRSHALFVKSFVVRPHFIYVLGEIANGPIAAASGACICWSPILLTDHRSLTCKAHFNIAIENVLNKFITIRSISTTKEAYMVLFNLQLSRQFVPFHYFHLIPENKDSLIDALWKTVPAPKTAECYYNWVCRQSFYFLQLHAHYAYGSIR